MMLNKFLIGDLTLLFLAICIPTEFDS